ncbi:MAG: hypothetical protein KIC61_01210 [Staphylococcus sp.]|nr:hypothetical protein [Staphylococcus sp.]
MKYIIKENKNLLEKVNKMNLEELLNCIICPNIVATQEDVTKALSCFIHPNTYANIKRKIESINSLNNHKMLFVTDMEAGAGSAIDGATRFPSMRAACEAGDEKLAYLMGKSAACEARKVGFHWTFGPCVDILGNHFSPITSIRSASENKNDVLKYTTAYMRGLQDFGLIATLKYFPGDGYTMFDHHLTTSFNPLTRKEWDDSYGYIYKQLINDGAKVIMAAHIALPAYDTVDHNGMYPPASLSYNLLTNLLKKDLGFEGIIISDATEMSGFCGYMNYYEACCTFLNAGGDCLLFAHSTEEFINKMKEYIASGKLTMEVIKNRAYRMLCFLEEYFEQVDKLPKNSDENFQIYADKMVDLSCKIYRDRNKLLPIKLDKQLKIAHVVIANQYDFSLAEKFTKKLSLIATVDELKDPGCKKLKEIAKSKEYDYIICSIGCFPWYGTNQITLSGVVARNMMNGWMKYDTKVIFVDFGHPYIHEEYDAMIDTLIYTYGYANNTIDKVLSLIFKK